MIKIRMRNVRSSPNYSTTGNKIFTYDDFDSNNSDTLTRERTSTCGTRKRLDSEKKRNKMGDSAVTMHKTDDTKAGH